MSLLILVVLTLVSALCLWRRWTRTGGLSMLTAVLFLVLIGQGWIPGMLLESIQSNQPLSQVEWKDRNVIVVLGSGAVKWADPSFLTTHPMGFSRLYDAARHYFRCKRAAKVCAILASGGDPRKDGVSEADVMKRELMELGVPESDLIVESNSHNTFQNAEFSSEILKSNPFDLVVLVTSGFHLSRALLYFGHYGVQVLGSPSDRLMPIFSLIPIAHNFAFNDIAIHERAGFLKYKLYQKMGWNAHSPKAGRSSVD